jgi:hypothetical protein
LSSKNEANDHFFGVCVGFDENKKSKPTYETKIKKLSGK